MKPDKLIALFLSAAAIVAYGSDWYVDANFGNDAWDGTTASIPTQEQIEAGGAIAGPRRTLHAMMSDDKVVAGDTVWAAEGDYNEGGLVNGTLKTVNRVQVKAGVKLAATGSRDATFITGSGGTGTGAYTNGAARCVYFLAAPEGVDYGRGIVKGFTLREGRTGDSGEHGGASTGAGLLVECNFENNGCKSNSGRGGTMNGGTALRCKFVSCENGYHGFSKTKIIDSLVDDEVGFYQNCSAYNCTFSGNGYLRQGGKSYNCLYIGNGASISSQNANDSNSYHYNTFSYYGFYDGSTIDDKCRAVNSDTAPYDTATFSPSVSSQVIDGGDLANYAMATNGWKQAWLDECGKDYYGGERVVNGKIDVGCGEFQGMDRPYVMKITDEDNALVVEGAEIGEEQFGEDFDREVTFSRKLTSEKLLAGVDVNGVFYSFGGTTDDYPVTVSLKWKFGFDYVIKAVYEEDQRHWYVNPTGNDENKGYHIKCPRRTLDKAMELAKENAGHIVHAAAGIYKEFPEGVTAASRVTVKAGVGLVADEWPFKETVIEGAKDTTSGEADQNGNGPNAVRCVYVNEGGYVKGFKLTCGRTKLGDSGAAPCGGGALLLGGALIDCEVTGNGCAYRGRGVSVSNQGDIKAADGTVIRCHIHDQVCGNYEINNGTVVDSRVQGSGSYTYYGNGLILNSTMLGYSLRSNMSRLRILNTYLHNATAVGDNNAYCTNCVFVKSFDEVDDEHIGCDEASCRFSVPMDDNLDENFRPKSAESPLVDFGDRALYDANFPKKWVQFKDVDFAGGQRIYNGKIDVGCGEYDWRGDFASLLGSKVAVTEMGPDVTANGESGIVVPEGESISLSMPPRASGRTTKYELVYTPDGGEQTVVTEVSAEAFSYTLAGPCIVQSLTRNGNFTITIR